MSPFLFGAPTRRMMGIFHPAGSSPASGAAVLICLPFGHELLRSQRFFRILCDRLARAGHPTLRFDYYGCGDSLGEDLDGELDGWAEDVGAAHDELRRLAPGRPIVWVGARLGATLALMAANGGNSTPTRVLAWDPVIDGTAYLEELRIAHVDAVARSYCVPDPRAGKLLAARSNAGPAELLGTELSPELCRQLAALNAVNLRVSARHDTMVLADPDDAPVRQWADAQAARELPVQFAPFGHTLDWTADPNPRSAMVPAEAVQRLLAELCE